MKNMLPYDVVCPVCKREVVCITFTFRHQQAYSPTRHAFKSISYSDPESARLYCGEVFDCDWEKEITSWDEVSSLYDAIKALNPEEIP